MAQHFNAQTMPVFAKASEQLLTELSELAEQVKTEATKSEFKKTVATAAAVVVKAPPSAPTPAFDSEEKEGDENNAGQRSV